MKLMSQAAVRLAAAIVLVICPVASTQSATPSGGEDFSTASLATSQLRPEPPELVDRDVEPGYISEWVTVRWRPDDPIYLHVIRPTKVKKPPVVIYLYDYPAETDIFRDDDWRQRVTGGGYAAVGFVPALSGQRYHGRPMKEWFVSELQEALAKSSHDAQMVLNYLDERGDVDMDRIGMFGVGAGATISVMAASADSRIKVIDLVDPWGDWPVWIAKSEVVPDQERPLFLKPEFLKGIAAFDPIALLPRLTTPRIRLDQLGQGSSIPEEAKKHIEAALPATAERHRFATFAEFDGMTASGGRAFDWIKFQLRAPGSKEAWKPSSDQRRSGLKTQPTRQAVGESVN